MKEKYCIYTHGSRFDTNEKCHDFLMQIRWDNGIPTCNECGNQNMNYYLKTRKLYKCSQCKKQFSLIKGTIFEKSTIPLTKWFMAIYLFTTKKRGISSVQLSKWLGVTQPTAWFMLQRLREAIKEENNIILSGIVEADELYLSPKTYWDKRLMAKKIIHEEEQKKLHGMRRDKRYKLGIKLKPGRKKGSTKEVLKQKEIERGGKPYDSHELDSYNNSVPFEKGNVILGMMERGGRVVMKKLGPNSKSVNRENVFPHLINHISDDAIFITDELNIYNTTYTLFKEHLSVNHKKGYVIKGIHINGIENSWKHLKKMITGTYFHMSHRHFDRYLNENTFRWNRRKESSQSLFESFIPLVVGKRIPYSKLTEKVAA